MHAIGAVHEQKKTVTSIPSNMHLERTIIQKNNATHERELPVVVDAIRKRRVNLHRIKFTAYRDHYLLKYVEMQKISSPKQLRCIEAIVAFSLTVIPICG